MGFCCLNRNFLFFAIFLLPLHISGRQLDDDKVQEMINSNYDEEYLEGMKEQLEEEFLFFAPRFTDPQFEEVSRRCHVEPSVLFVETFRVATLSCLRRGQMASRTCFDLLNCTATEVSKLDLPAFYMNNIPEESAYKILVAWHREAFGFGGYHCYRHAKARDPDMKKQKKALDDIRLAIEWSYAICGEAMKTNNYGDIDENPEIFAALFLHAILNLLCEPISATLNCYEKILYNQQRKQILDNAELLFNRMEIQKQPWPPDRGPPDYMTVDQLYDPYVQITLTEETTTTLHLHPKQPACDGIRPDGLFYYFPLLLMLCCLSGFWFCKDCSLKKNCRYEKVGWNRLKQQKSKRPKTDDFENKDEEGTKSQLGLPKFVSDGCKELDPKKCKMIVRYVRKCSACSTEFVFTKTSMKCGLCPKKNFAAYCSSGCRSDHWLNGHKDCDLHRHR